jgi:beta-lactamase regulating signal transducer with metallopeptidase domain
MNVIQWLGNDDILRLVLTLAVQVSLVLGATLCSSWICRSRTAARHAVCLSGLCVALVCPLATVAAQQVGIGWLVIPWPASDGPVPATVAGVSPAAPELELEVPGADEAHDATPSPPKDGFTVDAELEYGLAERAVGQRLTAPDPGATQASPTSANVAIRPGVLATSLVVMVWFIGVVYLMLRWVRTAMQLRRTVRASRSIIPASGGRQPAEWTDITSSAPLLPQLRLAKVASSRTLPVPIVYGVFRPRIIIPESLLRPGAEDLLRDVLIHELSHVLRRDPLVHLLQRLATILYWPHPLVYFVDRQLSATREDLCDNHVLQHRRPADYARTLLQLTEGISVGTCPQAALAMLPQWSSLEQRVAALLDPGRPTSVRNARWLNGLIAAGAACVGMVAAGIHAQNPASAIPLAVVTQAESSDAAAETSEPDPTRRLITGIVVDENRRPVVGATVRYASPLLTGISALTNADGRFELLIPARMHRYRWFLLAADATGEMLGYAEVLDEDLDLEPKAEITLAPANRATATVRTAAGQPVGGAIITVVAGEHIVAVAEAVTDESGIATIRYPSQLGVLWVLARKDGAGFDYFENYSARLQRHHGPLPGKVQLMLADARTVKFRVTDSTGAPIPNSSAYLHSFKTPGKLGQVNTTGAIAIPVDDAGNAQISWLPAEFDKTIAIGAEHTDYEDGESAVVRVDDDTSDYRVRLRKRATIAGHVRDLDGRPASGIRVFGNGEGEIGRGGRPAWARTDTDGAYRLSVEPDVAFLVSVTDADFAAVARSTDFIEEGAMVEGVDLTLIRGALVKGRITAGDDRAPVSRAMINLTLQGEPLPVVIGRPRIERRLMFRAWSDVEGRYTLRVPPGRYLVTIYTSESAPPRYIEIAENNTPEAIVVDQHFDSPANPPLRGRLVRQPDGAAVSKASVYVALVGRNNLLTDVSCVTNDDGQFVIERNGARHFVYAMSPDGLLSAFTVVGPEQSDISLELAPSATVVGQIVDPEGKPLNDLEVGGQVQSPGVDGARVRIASRTDEQGRYRITGVPVGCEFALVLQRVSPAKDSGFIVQHSGELELEARATMRRGGPHETKHTRDVQERLLGAIEAAEDDAERRTLLRRAVFLAEEVLAYPELTPGDPIDAVKLLSRLNARPAHPDRKSPAVPFTAAHKPLLRVLSDSKFAADTRAAAAEGLTRILNDADDTVDGGGLSDVARRQIQEALAAAEKESIRPAPPVRRSPD